MKRGWMLLLGLLVAGAAPAEAPFEPAWARLAGRDGWQMLVSPAFPAEWPARGGVVRYAFAMRLRPGLADGAEMAAPFARSLGGRVEVLSSRIAPLGVQGVRPLRAEEVALAGEEERVAELLARGGAAAESELVRRFTCGWAGRMGVEAAAILPWHPGFAAWLGCAR